MKILLLGKCLDGGTGTFFFSMINLEAKEKSNIKIIPVVLEKPSFTIPPKNIKIKYFASSSSYPERYNLSPNFIFLLIKELFWLNSIINKDHPDCIISIDFHCALLSELYKFIFNSKIKSLVTFHNNLRGVFENKATPLLRFFLTHIAGFFLNRSNQVIGVSKELSFDIKKLLRLRTIPKIINYGIKINKLEFIYKERVNNNIISIARFFEQKDHQTLLKSFVIVQNKIKSAKLFLVGDGPLKNELITLSKKLKIDNKIVFTGWVKNPIRLLKKSALFVLSTKREGFGYVIIEAMSLGLPTIVTDAPFGPSEILNEGKFGILTPVGDAKKMADSIIELLLNKERYIYYSKKSIERVQAFNIKNMLKQYVNLIDS